MPLARSREVRSVSVSNARREVEPQLGVRFRVVSLVVEVVFELGSRDGVARLGNGVLQVGRKSGDMRPVQRGVDGQLLTGQRAILPGHVERMAKNRTGLNLSIDAIED